MQSREEYEADYYGQVPFRLEREPANVNRRVTNRRPEWQGPGPVRPQMSCCQGRMNELLEEMELALELQSDEVRRIVAEIRKVCGSIDGRGCMVMENAPSRERMDMLLEQVMDRLEGSRMPEEGDDWAEDGDRYRELVEALIWQELLRRKMRRQMPGRDGQGNGLWGNGLRN